MIFIFLEFLRENEYFQALSLFGAVMLMLFGIAFHEFSHALSANALGDRTAREQGRLTLNPLVHLDPFGTLLLFLVGFGWGRPTPVNPYALRNGPRTGMAMVAAAGPLSNLIFAGVLAMVMRLGWVPWHDPFVIGGTAGWALSDYVGLFLSAGILLNVILAVFNLLPLAPLDGFKVAVGLLPMDLARPVAQLERHGMVILMVLFFMPFLVGLSFFGDVMLPAAEGIAGALTGS